MTALVQGHLGLRTRHRDGLDPFQKAAIAVPARCNRVFRPDNRCRRRLLHCDQSVFGLYRHPSEVVHREVCPQIYNSPYPVRIDWIEARKIGQKPLVYDCSHDAPHNLRLIRISFPTLSRWRHDCGRTRAA
jgi:hypothetical protein